jgi:hypothetical protein
MLQKIEIKQLNSEEIGIYKMHLSKLNENFVKKLKIRVYVWNMKIKKSH